MILRISNRIIWNLTRISIFHQPRQGKDSYAPFAGASVVEGGVGGGGPERLCVGRERLECSLEPTL